MARPRTGFEPWLQKLVELVGEQPQALLIEGFDADYALEELRLFNQAQTVVQDARLQLSLGLETRALHGSNAWQVVLRIYQHAKAAARDNPEIANAISGFEQFMKKGGRKKKTAPTTPVTP